MPDNFLYKFKSLKAYSSPEWMLEATKRYRKVYDRSEISYMYFELVLHNKQFDRKDWEGEAVFCVIKEREEDTEEEICRMTKKFFANKTDSLIHLHESWGTRKEGSFWTEGSYVCRVFIKDKLIGEQNFYIHDVGIPVQGSNPYFKLSSLRLYESDQEGSSEDECEYLKVFSKEDTRYVWFEIKLLNKLNIAYNLEFFINVYDGSGHPKARIETLSEIEAGQQNKILTFERGWGNKNPGSWASDKYYVEIVFMNTLIASASFRMGDEEEEGMPEPGDKKVVQEIENTSGKESLEDLLEKLDNLVGLNTIKQQVKDHITYVDFLKLRKEKGLEDNESIALHSVFTGNPGTGKTTVVKLLGKIYEKKGLLTSGHVHEVDRAALVGEFIGQTAPKVKKAIDAARGGILFIDEAYMLARSDSDAKDFGQEVIEVLVKEMSDGDANIAIMMAGYPKETMFMINSNPGLKSRIKYFFHFDDYTPDELFEISLLAAEENHVTPDKQAKTELKRKLTEAFRNRDETFGNGRYAHTLIEKAKINMALRIMSSAESEQLSPEELSLLKAEDIAQIQSLNELPNALQIPTDDRLLAEAMQELDNLIGLQKIKQEISELIKLVKYYRETGKEVLNKFYLHAVFSGNPGTGKTTLARIFGKIYKALGLLERGHVVETGKEGLVAGYVGQTALKTKEKIDEALGGILFIDEAYALASGAPGDNFGNEAVEVILKNMEDNRGKFAVIAAGYPDNMENFLKINPGLKSRFDKTFIFEDYEPETLYHIFLQMIASEKLTPDAETEKYLKDYIKKAYRQRDKYFGNARFIRQIAEEAIKKQHLRMAEMPLNERNKTIESRLTLKDVQKIEVNKPLRASSSIGF